MNHVVKKARILKKELRISLIKYYVDDTILIVHKVDVNSVLEHFKSIQPETQFTTEKENNGKLLFLDFLLIFFQRC